jgi:hypothetical protein
VIPGPLARWAALEDLFAPDLAAALGPWLDRLALAIGPPRRPAGGGLGDPEGFAGLARRGPYERLLASEWLLADEAPDEFLRRATAGEHAFLALARRSQARASASRVLFDAGPAQLGAPRLAHLALLFVLADRAARAGASHGWGVLGERDAALATVASRESVLRLLGARTSRRTTADDVAAACEAARRDGVEDVWIVGAASSWGRLGPACARASIVDVVDPIDPDRRVLAVTARPAGAAPRTIELALPTDAEATRLLRDPFGARSPVLRRTSASVAPASNLVFAPNGAKIFARTASGDVVAYPVPGSPRDATGKPKRFHPRRAGVVTGVGWHQRALVMFVVRDQVIALESPHRPELGAVVERAGRRIAEPDAAAPLGNVGVIAADRDHPARMFAVDARGGLVAVRAGATIAEHPARGVVALSGRGGRVAFVASEIEPAWLGESGDRPWRGLVVIDGSGKPAFRALPWEGESAVHLAWGKAPEGGAFEPIAAIAREGRRLSLLHPAWSADLELPAGSRVLALGRGGPRAPIEVACLEEGGRALCLVGRASERTLPAERASIVDVAFDPEGRTLATLTSAGDVAIRGLADGALWVAYEPVSA